MTNPKFSDFWIDEDEGRNMNTKKTNETAVTVNSTTSISGGNSSSSSLDSGTASSPIRNSNTNLLTPSDPLHPSSSSSKKGNGSKTKFSLFKRHSSLLKKHDPFPSFEVINAIPINKLEKKEDLKGDAVSLMQYKSSDETRDHLVRKKVSMDSKDINLLIRSTTLIRTLQHDYVLPCVKTIVVDRDIWFLSPFFPDLDAFSKSQPFGLSEPVVCCIIKQALWGLNYLHSKGIVLRSFNGSHILLSTTTSNQTLRACITGLFFSVESYAGGEWIQKHHVLPQVGNRKDVYNFLAPEVLYADNYDGYDERSDTYSVGVTLCQLANGMEPFRGMDSGEMLLHKLTGNHPVAYDITNLDQVQVEDLPDEDQVRFQVYSNKKFTPEFHQLIRSLCLCHNRWCRPFVAQVLKNPIMKRIDVFDTKYRMLFLSDVAQLEPAKESERKKQQQPNLKPPDEPKTTGISSTTSGASSATLNS